MPARQRSFGAWCSPVRRPMIVIVTAEWHRQGCLSGRRAEEADIFNLPLASLHPVSPLSPHCCMWTEYVTVFGGGW
jgi:hypothetical protein